MHQCIKMEFQKIVNFLNTNSDENLPRFITKKWVEIMINQKKIITQTNKLELKHQC